MVNKKDFTGGKARGEVRWKCSVSQAVFTRVMHFQSIFLSFSFPSPFSDTEKMKKTLGKEVQNVQALLIVILLELFITLWAKRDALASLFSHVFASRKGIYDYDPDLLSSQLQRVMDTI